MIVNFPKFPPLEKMHQLDFGQCLFWVPHREIEVFYEGSSGWQRARPVPNLWVTVVMTGAGGKWRWWWRSFFKSCICVSSYIPPLLFYLFCLSFFPWSLSFPIPNLFLKCVSLTTFSLSTSPPPLPLFHSFPTINLWLSKPVVSSGGLAERGMRDLRSFTTEVWE